MISITFIPLEKFNEMKLEDKVDMIIEKSKKDEIIIIEGILKPEEEMELIKKTMENISRIFRGIEIESLTAEELKGGYKNLMEKLRSKALDALMGRKRGITVIGPATIVKKIKKNPGNISLWTK
ncbi:hypothetical protein DRN62_02975 [Nanoarchaeota archaeon]|nr:DUF2073 domain-containing protein [Nanoarchaeota archaeon]RLG16781.1 MAG: hypothetical protein DRN62_02975 [Nanoarchaeota archaeon]